MLLCSGVRVLSVRVVTVTECVCVRRRQNANVYVVRMYTACLSASNLYKQQFCRICRNECQREGERECVSRLAGGDAEPIVIPQK